jgi:hypothetical protein
MSIIINLLKGNRKHEDKHTRPYSCTHSSCPNKNFSDKGSLGRHIREVHAVPIYKCPVTSCPRNKNGFNRKYNLWEHKRRRHQKLLSKPTTHEETSDGGIISTHEGTCDGIIPTHEETSDNGKMQKPYNAADGRCITKEASVQAKLEDLLAIRA